jgi:hypothetical protein
VFLTHENTERKAIFLSTPHSIHNAKQGAKHSCFNINDSITRSTVLLPLT